VGTGGIPNLRIIEDYATGPMPEYWFEVHMALRFKGGADGAIAARKAFENDRTGDFTQAKAALKAALELDPSVPSEKFERLIDALYRVEPGRASSPG
jgi:hypothetical protein